MIRRPPRSTLSSSSAASDVYKRQVSNKAFKRIVDKTYIGKNNLSLVTYKDVNTSMWAYEDILCASNTFLNRKDRYIAHWVKEDKNQFNIDTSDLKIVQKNFQRNPR